MRKAEVDIPALEGVSGLSGKWTFLYLTGKQRSTPFPPISKSRLTTLIQQELAARRNNGLAINKPFKFIQAQHMIFAYPSTCTTNRQEFYHGLAVDKIYVTSQQGKERAEQTLASRAEAMKKAKSKVPLVYRVETVDTIDKGALPLMDGK
jgi:hypothetical protein